MYFPMFQIDLLSNSYLGQKIKKCGSFSITFRW